MNIVLTTWAKKTVILLLFLALMFVVFAGVAEAKKMILPSDLTLLSEGVFENCTLLSEVVFGENLIEKLTVSCVALVKNRA